MPGWFYHVLSVDVCHCSLIHVFSLFFINTWWNELQKAKAKKPEIVQVIAAYNSTGPEQLSLEKGQLIQVRKKNNSGWWEGEVQIKGQGKKVGWFPATYVKSMAGGGGTSGTASPSKI